MGDEEELPGLESGRSEVQRMKEAQDLQRKVELDVLKQEQQVDRNLLENEFKQKEKELEEAA